MADIPISSSENRVLQVDLLHPEVLSCTQLKELLNQKNIPLEGCDAEKSKLLELYYKYIMPLPQRDYRLNRRGQVLSRKRLKLLKRKVEVSSQLDKDSMEPLQKSARLINTITLNTPDASCRLKTPPNITLSEKKIVKLNSKLFNGSESFTKQGAVSPTGNSKIIRLINDTLSSNVKSSSIANTKSKKTDPGNNIQVQNSAEGETPPTKKHKPITWP